MSNTRDIQLFNDAEVQRVAPADHRKDPTQRALKEERALLKKQGYYIVGQHSGVKLCHWTKNKICGGQGCYKETFYGIDCHRCIQMTPTIDRCNLQCQFCWRHMSWQDSFGHDCDEPKDIVLGAIEGQKKLLSGYGGNPKADVKLYKEALKPNQTAISLTGEPTMYPYIGELIKEYESRGIQTFLVTNGTLPNVIEKMERLPTQLYVTVAAPDEETYNRLCAPMGKRGWKDLMKTLELLPSLSCRTVVRHTLVKNWNMHGAEEYARLDRIARPDFIECKGYSFVGESRLRMTMDNMPSHEEIRVFSSEIARRTGYDVAGERQDSRVQVLTEKPEKMRLAKRDD